MMDTTWSETCWSNF